MNSTIKFKFKTIDVDTDGVQFRNPYTHNPYDQLTPRKDIVKAWKEECRLRAEELETYHNEISDSGDELVQEADTDARAESD